MPRPSKPRRLSRVFTTHGQPIYFVTFCTHERGRFLAAPTVNDRLHQFARRAETKGVAIGRYVLMPDHFHGFIRMSQELDLGTTVRLLKRSLSASIDAPMPHWQPGFFDHVMRSGESYAEKWVYVQKNPVRAGLVDEAPDWPFQGEIVLLSW